jgi:hypothetical protein
VLSTKYDGHAHFDYPAYLLHPGDGSAMPLRLYVPAGTPVRSGYRGDYEIVTPFTALFWPGSDRWWNVEHNHHGHPRTSGGRLFSYANVSTPATFDGDTVRWVDLDLDVIVTEDGAALVDEDEFAQHREQFGYPEDVVARAWDAAQTLLQLATTGAPPFDRDEQIAASTVIGLRGGVPFR